jgi:hypothetical protein
VSAERIGLVLERFLLLCGSYREDLERECHLIDSFSFLAGEVLSESLRKQQERTDRLQEILKARPDLFSGTSPLTIENRYIFSGFNIPKCKVMSSAKRPIFLSLVGESGGRFDIIFKHGDDLR